MELRGTVSSLDAGRSTVTVGSTGNTFLRVVLADSRAQLPTARVFRFRYGDSPWHKHDITDTDWVRGRFLMPVSYDVCGRHVIYTYDDRDNGVRQFRSDSISVTKSTTDEVAVVAPASPEVLTRRAGIVFEAKYSGSLLVDHRQQVHWIHGGGAQMEAFRWLGIKRPHAAARDLVESRPAGREMTLGGLYSVVFADRPAFVNSASGGRIHVDYGPTVVHSLGAIFAITDRRNLVAAGFGVGGWARHARAARDRELRGPIQFGAFASAEVRFLDAPAGVVFVRLRAEGPVASWELTSTGRGEPVGRKWVQPLGGVVEGGLRFDAVGLGHRAVLLRERRRDMQRQTLPQG